jgi:hypothetical protein
MAEIARPPRWQNTLGTTNDANQAGDKETHLLSDMAVGFRVCHKGRQRIYIRYYTVRLKGLSIFIGLENPNLDLSKCFVCLPKRPPPLSTMTEMDYLCFMYEAD